MDIPCNICGSAEQVVVFPAGRAQICQIVRCARCQLMYASPRPRSDVDDIVSWNAEEVYQITKSQDQDRIDKQTIQRRDYRDTRLFLDERHPEKGRLVEVGSSLGYLLDYFRSDGWDVAGVEPNAGCALYAERELGIPTVPKTLGDADMAPESVDALLMMHVIEHVPDPVSVFADVRRVLKTNGTFVVETPRYDSLAFKLLGHRERSVSCDGHIYFFTTQTLEALARKSGFKILRCDYVGRSMTVARLLYNLGVMSKSKAAAESMRSISGKLSLNKLSLYLNARDMMRMYLERA
jgi:2-polyprenyl-3-methyl-5-hydroxy-6-metoxy-1,4-benzoquinol methylase